MNNIAKWVKALIKDDSINRAAEKSDINQSTLNRQLASGKISAETVIALAGGYGISRYQALIDTGFIPASDRDSLQIELSLANATDSDLVNEVIKRIADGRPGSDIYSKPIGIAYQDETDQSGNTDATITHLNLAAHDPGDDYIEESDHLYD